MWFAGDLVAGGNCGGQGIGLWSSPDGVTWTTGACRTTAAKTTARACGWITTRPAHSTDECTSPTTISPSGRALYVTYSDNGTTWSAPVHTQPELHPRHPDHRRPARQWPSLCGVDERGRWRPEHPAERRCTARPTAASAGRSVNVGPSLQGPGRSACSANGYFACMFGTNDWRHMGWGEPAANGNNVFLDWAACGSGGNTVCTSAADHGDIWFIRSTDAGLTWGTPVKLNTDSGTAMQWQPSLTATQSGTIFASWYDQREVNGGADLNCTAGSSSQNCYRRWGRISYDNGATWQADDMVGRALSPLPAQPDGAVQPNYQGDYDYHSSFGFTMIGGWTDGRNIISGQSQQDVFVNFVQGPSPTASPTPTATATASPRQQIRLRPRRASLDMQSLR